MNQLTVTALKGATIRTGPSTSGGIIRAVPLGTMLDYVNLISYANGDIWALLTQTDPATLRPWVFAKAETAVFVAVYVNKQEYAKLTRTELESPATGGLTSAQKASFRAVTEPAVRWLCDNCNPHTQIAITGTSAELLTGEHGFTTTDYIKD